MVCTRLILVRGGLRSPFLLRAEYYATYRTHSNTGLCSMCFLGAVCFSLGLISASPLQQRKPPRKGKATVTETGPGRHPVLCFPNAAGKPALGPRQWPWDGSWAWRTGNSLLISFPSRAWEAPGVPAKSGRGRWGAARHSVTMAGFPPMSVLGAELLCLLRTKGVALSLSWLHLRMGRRVGWGNISSRVEEGGWT